MRTVKCIKLGVELPGLDAPPLNGEIGQRIFENVSAEAWAAWLEHAKTIINEYRLNMGTKEARQVMRRELERYFFGEGSEAPKDFVPLK